MIYPISYPAHSSEFEIQSTLFEACKKKGFIIRGEVKGTFAHQERTARGFRTFYKKYRFDLVIYRQTRSKHYEAIAIIEVKKRPAHLNKPSTYAQISQYTEFGLPIFLCSTYEDIHLIIQKIELLLTNQLTALNLLSVEHLPQKRTHLCRCRQSKKPHYH